MSLWVNRLVKILAAKIILVEHALDAKTSKNSLSNHLKGIQTKKISLGMRQVFV